MLSSDTGKSWGFRMRDKAFPYERIMPADASLLCKFSTLTVTMQNPFKIACGDGILHS